MWINCKYTCIPSFLNLLPIPPPSHPSRSSQSTRLSFLCYTATSHYLCVLHMVMYIFQSTLSIHPPLSFPTVSTVHSLCLCLYSFPANRFIGTIFLDSMYMHYYTIFIFLFMTYFTPCNRFQICPPQFKWLKFVPFYGWVIFHCIYVPPFLY